MTIFTKKAKAIYEPQNPNGTQRRVINNEAMVWGTEVEAIVDLALASGGFLLYETKAALDADLDHPANTGAMVLGDSAANDGIYSKSGVSGAGSWTKVAEPLTSGFVKAVDDGGTANAIEATTDATVNETQFITVPIVLENTSGTVTVGFNGGSALTIKTISGNDPVIGGFTAGAIVSGYINGSEFQLLSDQTSAAIQAAAEAAELAAEGYAADAAASAATIGGYAIRDFTNATTIAALPNGTKVQMDGLRYIVDTTATGVLSATNDLSVDGISVDGISYPAHHGPIGGGSDDDDATQGWFKFALRGFVSKLDVDLRMNTVFTGTATANVNISYIGDPEISFVNATHAVILIQIYNDDFDFTASFNKIDANQKAKIILWIRNEGTGKPKHTLSDTMLSNPYGITSGDQVSGIFLAGSFSHVQWKNVRAENVSRAAGLSVATYCQALVISRLLTPLRNPTNITIDDCSVNVVDTQDTDGTRREMDGLVVFQDEETNQSCNITNFTSFNCLGRDMKLAVHNPNVIGAVIYQDRLGKDDEKICFACQYGSGVFTNCGAIFRGTDTHSNGISGTTVFSFYTATAGLWGGSRVVSNCWVKEISSGQRIKAPIDFSVANSIAAEVRIWDCRVDEFVVEGNTTEAVVRLNNVGVSPNWGSLTVTGGSGNITSAYGLCDSNLASMRAVMSGMFNLSGSKTVLQHYSGSTITTWGTWHNGGGNVGWLLSGPTPYLEAI
ncbi:MAG: hypothetical protein JKY50_22480 [Oleispira sp.]|nr:hypothetical protein [Oleispira sp.]